MIRRAVASPASNVVRQFLTWDRPLLPQAVALLTERWVGEGPLDLADLAVVVPTRQSGRRLREALAAHAARGGAAVFPPRVLLPESLLVPADARTVATRAEVLLAWTEVLRAADLDEFRTVLPVKPPAQDVGWALGLARQFVRLQHVLAEAGLRIGDVAARLAAGFPELDRWRELGELERRQEQELSAWGRLGPAAARLETARQPAVPDGIRRVVVIATPDPQPLALTALAALAAQLPVEIVIHAPAAEAARFDAWGRPIPDAWSLHVLALPAFEEHVHLCADPAAQAKLLAAAARGYGASEDLLGIGVADPEVLPLLEQALAGAGLASFNPEGRPRQGDALFQLLDALARLAREPAFSTVQALVRCPDFLAYLESRFGPDFSGARLLAALDDLQTRHLPPTLAEARRHATNPAAVAARVPDVLAIIAELAEPLRTRPFPASAGAVLAQLFGARRFDVAEPAAARTVDAATTWSDLMGELSAALARVSGWTVDDGWSLALQLYAESLTYAEKPAGAVEMQGWLELLWEDAPHLVVAGLNDGRVPEAIVGDPFLPESLRVRLGLKSNAARLARDAYILQALAASRSDAPRRRLDLLLGKTTAAGDPLRPSRLLLQCADAELPARVAFLFRSAESPRDMPAWRRSWRVAPPIVPPPAQVAVTGLRQWLDCPFRFYLSRVLRMQPVDPAKTELDVLDFGTLCHAALEALGAEPALRDTTDAAVLRQFLIERLEAAAARRFGRDLTLPLVVQLESARQRLSRAADVQALCRADGWVIQQVEQPFTVPVGGLQVTGKIDRIDRHEGTGAWRVLDYKTSDRPVSPAQAHLRPTRRDETAPEFARLMLGGREYVWTDLQLPLYLRAVAAHAAIGAGAVLQSAYFNLPKAVSETALVPWDDFTPELAEAAWRCAEGVAAAIAAGQFWPPNEQVPAERDEFAPLFHHGVADSVEWRGGVRPLVQAGEAAP
jgi:ATP-dependent helicase/nuclease subunit B